MDYRDEEYAGILLNDPDKTIYQDVTIFQRENGYASVVATNDPRMLAALSLLGYETVARTKIEGVERFKKL